MKKTDFALEIYHCDDGFVVKDNDGKLSPYQNDEADREEENPTSAAVKLFWGIIEFFNINPSRGARERIAVIVEAGDKYVLKKGEKLVSVFYQVVKTDEEILNAMKLPSEEE